MLHALGSMLHALLNTTMLASIHLIGMIHLLPLPGSPRYDGSRQRILERALYDAEILAETGFDAVLIENYGDIPFAKEDAGRHVVAEMALIACRLKERHGLPFGVQVLRNDAKASIAVAAASGAAFVRINVHTGTMLTDQGIIEGNAHDTLRYRESIGAHDVAILADVHVKHATPLGAESFESALRDTVHRGLADAVIVSGSGTGMKTDPALVEKAARLCDVPIYVGSGADDTSMDELFTRAHGVIVGTSLKEGGVTQAPVDAERCRRFVEAARRCLARNGS